MRKLIFGLLMALLLAVTVASSALAITLQDGSRLHVVPGGTIDDDVIFAGETVIIEGTINGDVFAFANYVEVRGKINGNLITAANNIRLPGSVAGSVFAAGNTVEVDGRVDGSLTGAGSSVRVTERGSVGRSLIAAGDRIDLDGKVERGALTAGSRIAIRGGIGRELSAWGGDLFLSKSAVIQGPVTYSGQRPATVEDGARTGELTYHEYKGNEYDLRWSSAWWLALRFTGFVLAGLALLALFPALRRRFPELVQAKPWEVPVAGLVALVAMPVGLIILMVTVVGIPIGLFGLLALPLLIYLSQILVAWALGRVLAERVALMQNWSWPLLFLTGALATTLLVQLPFVGGLFGLLWLLYGLGGLWFLVGRKAV